MDSTMLRAARSAGNEAVVPVGGTPGSYPTQPTHIFPSSSEFNMGLKKFLSLVNRRRFLIGMTAFLLTMVAFVVIWQITPIYTSEASLLIPANKPDVIDQQPVVPSLQPDAAVIRSEVDVIRSPQLATKVIEKLALRSNPIFTKNMIFPGEHNEGSNLVTRLLGFLPKQVQPFFYDAAAGLKLLPSPIDFTFAEQDEQANQIMVTRLLENLIVATDARSNTIKLTYSSPDPKLSTLILKTVVDLYRVDQLDAKFEATQRANKELSKQIAQLQQQAEAADNAVAIYSGEHGLTAKDAAGTTVQTQQLAEVNTQLIIAQADQAQKESRLRQFQIALKTNEAAAASTPEVVASTTIAQLKAAESDIIRRKADAEQKYGSKNPNLVGINAELRSVHENIRNEMNKIVQALAQDAEAARIRTDTLRASVQQAQALSAKSNDAGMKLAQLKRDAQSIHTFLDTYVARSKETNAQISLQTADARVIANASLPIKPSFPPKAIMLALALAASLSLGVVFAFMIEQLDNAFRNSEEIERYTGIPQLGHVPAVPALSAGNIADYVIKKPLSNFGESIRSVRAALRYTNTDKEPKIVLITSSVPDEGKSLFAVSMAREAAMSGLHTLLIDCDVRRPSIHGMLGGNKDATLIDLFLHDKDSNEVINVDEGVPNGNLHFIVARPHAIPNPPDFFASAAMAHFLEKMAETYDFIVIDTPPVMACSDAAVLANKADAVIFAVQWGVTPRPVVINAVKSMANMNVKPRGVVLTRVNVKKHARYGLGDQGDYYGRYKVYSTP